MDHRYGRVKWGPHGERIRTSPANWRKPRQWAKAANGHRPRIFCASLADVFDNQVPNQWRAELFDMIRDTTELDWLLLTKRPENISKMFPDGYWPNIWLGTTCEDQERANRRVMRSRVPVLFLSCEPLIGSIDFERGGWALHRPIKSPQGEQYRSVDWIIVGGESGHGARYMEPSWARAIRDDCRAAAVPFFMKQMTSKKPIPDDLLVREFPKPVVN